MIACLHLQAADHNLIAHPAVQGPGLQAGSPLAMSCLTAAPPGVGARPSSEMRLPEPRPVLLSSSRSPGPALARAQRSARCRGRRRGRVSRPAAVLDVPGGPRVASFCITGAGDPGWLTPLGGDEGHSHAPGRYRLPFLAAHPRCRRLLLYRRCRPRRYRHDRPRPGLAAARPHRLLRHRRPGRRRIRPRRGSDRPAAGPPDRQVRPDSRPAVLPPGPRRRYRRCPYVHHCGSTDRRRDLRRCGCSPARCPVRGPLGAPAARRAGRRAARRLLAGVAGQRHSFPSRARPGRRARRGR